MDDRELFILAKEVAAAAHQGQFRHDGVTPYISHPLAVAESLESPTCKIIAVLHDVLEDSDITAYVLWNKCFPRYIVDAVVALTKVKGESYLNYLHRVKRNNFALQVKVADIQHNMQTSKGTMKDKYELALYILGL